MNGKFLLLVIEAIRGKKLTEKVEINLQLIGFAFGEEYMHIEHIAMYVTELEKTKEFFVKYFNATPNEGYHNKTSDFRSYFLSFDGETRLEIMNRPGMQDEEKGLQRTMRITARTKPIIIPHSRTAISAYSEQVGSKRQVGFCFSEEKYFL